MHTEMTSLSASDSFLYVSVTLAAVMSALWYAVYAHRQPHTRTHTHTHVTSLAISAVTSYRGTVPPIHCHRGYYRYVTVRWNAIGAGEGSEHHEQQVTTEGHHHLLPPLPSAPAHCGRC